MPTNGYHAQYHERPGLTHYDSYEGSDYDSPQYQNAGPYDGFHFSNSPHDEKPDPISVNTRVRGDDNRDSVGQHLLYENALMDSAQYEIMEIDEVDALKKELARLSTQIEAAKRKLALEYKVKDAAQNLLRLNTLQKNRPDTPQRNERKNDSTRMSQSMENLLQANNELAESVHKVDDLNESIKDLMERRAQVDRKLMRHTAAVLAEEANNKATSAVAGLANGHHAIDGHNSMYMADDFDGIRDILRGAPPSSVGKAKEYEQQMGGIQERLEQLNSELRNVIDEAGRTLGKNAPAEPPLDRSADASARLENRFARLEDNVIALKQQQSDTRAHYARIQDDEYESRNAVEEQMQSLNKQLHNAILYASESEPVPGLKEPPRVVGQGYQQQVQYMEESMLTMEQLIQRNLSSARPGSQSQLSEFQDTVMGLWEILLSDAPSPKTDTGAFENTSAAASVPSTPFREPFTLQAFSTRVQHMFDKVQSAKEQQDILRRQIQQQRDLNGKSDAEKDRQIGELQTTHEQASMERDQAQEELAKLMVTHQETESAYSQSKNELVNVMNEVESLRKTMDTHQQQRDDIASLESKHKDESSALEGEVIRLTTELTMARADLDAAHGSRAERADANKAAQLEKELAEMTTEFQELTKESIELEKEREQLDALIDSLRERVDALETELSDEKVKWIGLKPPQQQQANGEGDGGAVQPHGSVFKESTSISVLRQEFKKMLRESRAEGMKLIRTEQEERRRLEVELRKHRQANGPLAKLKLSPALATNGGGAVNGALLSPTVAVGNAS